jgi:hypothetical protein
MDNFEHELYGNDVVNGRLDGEDKTIKTLCETRWCIRGNALAIFKAAFPVIVSNLRYLQTNGDAIVLRINFILPLVVYSHI